VFKIIFFGVFTASADTVAHLSSHSVTLFHEKVKLGNEYGLASALSHCLQRIVSILLGTVSDKEVVQ
jgi:hypothetical protein